MAVCTLILLGPALFNGYPLVYPDSGTYIWSSVALEPPIDRPIGYGMFMRAVTWRASLWPVAIVQCLLLNVLLWRTTKLLLGHARPLFPHLVTVVLLTATTGIAWQAGQLMPDVFTPLLALSLLLFLLEVGTSHLSRILLGILIFTATATHMSHLVMGLLLLAAICLWAFLRRRQALPIPLKKILLRSTAALALMVASVLALSSYNASMGQGFKPSPNPHVFLMGRLVETGIAATFLREHCDEHSYSLCLHRDSLNKSAVDFIWRHDGPFWKTGEWRHSEAGYKELISDIFTSPRYLLWFGWEGIKAGCSQMAQVQVGDAFSQGGEDSPAFIEIQRHFPHEEAQFLNAVQGKRELQFPVQDTVFPLLLGAAVILLCYAWMNRRLLPLQQVSIGVLLAAICLNAFVTGALGNVLPRLQMRMSWLLVFVGAMVLIQLTRGWWEKQGGLLPQGSQG